MPYKPDIDPELWQHILKLRGQGLTWETIGTRVDRSPGSLRARYNRLRRRGAAASELSEQRAELVQQVQTAVIAGNVTIESVAIAVGANLSTVSMILWRLGLDRKQRELLAGCSSRSELEATLKQEILHTIHAGSHIVCDIARRVKICDRRCAYLLQKMQLSSAARKQLSGYCPGKHLTSSRANKQARQRRK